MIKKFIPIALSIIMIFAMVGCQKTEPLDTASLDTEAKTLVTQLAEGDYAGALEDHAYIAKLQAFFKTTPYENVWSDIQSKLGEFVAIYDTKGISAQNAHAVVVKTAFTESCADISVTFNSKGQIQGFHYKPNTDSPQDHGAPTVQLPQGITERELTFGDEFPLGGTLTTPDGEGPFPVVILVHGSGPHDRDETVKKIKVFRDMAWGLAQQGVATFRYDKRTYAHPASFTMESTAYDETAADAIHAAKLMTEQKEIDPNAIVVAGHSLGAIMIPKIAAETPEVSGYVMMAGAVTPLQDLLVIQTEYMMQLDGSLSATDKLNLSSLKGMRDNVNKLTPDSKLEPKALFNIPKAYWLYIKDYNPAEAAKAIEKPLMVTQGEGDYQVTMDEFNAIKSTLGDKENVSYKSYPGLSHLFTPAGDPPAPTDYDIEANVDTAVIDDLAEFVKSLS